MESSIESEATILTVEALLEQLGGFSWFQFFATVVVVAPELSASMISLSPVLTGSRRFCYNETSHPSPSCEKPSWFPGTSKTVIVEWNLEGRNEWITDVFISLQMFGALFGALFAGQLAERFVRL